MTVSLRGKRAYLDASVTIYSLEKLHEFPNLKLGLLDLLDEGSLIGVTSELTLLETVVGPRKKGDPAAEVAFRKFLSILSPVEVRPIDTAVLERAVDLRLLGLKTPDAIHVATGMLEGRDVFLTRDEDWARAGIIVVDPADVA